MKNNFYIVVILVLGIVLFRKSCSTQPVETEVITEIETKWDTLKVSKTEYVPKIIRKTIVDIDTFSVPVDTSAILSDYFAKNYVIDTISLDSLGFVVIRDTISRNLISFRDVQSDVLIPTTTITNTSYIYRREFFWGVALGGMTNPVQDESPISYVSGELMYINKKRNAYGFGFGVDKDLLPIVSGRIYFKIGK